MERIKIASADLTERVPANVDGAAREVDAVVAWRDNPTQPDRLRARDRVRLQRHFRLRSKRLDRLAFHCAWLALTERRLRGVQRSHARRSAQRDGLQSSRSRPRRVRSPDNTPAPALGYLASAAFAGAFTATGGRLRNPKQLRRDERCLQRREISGSILDADGASCRGREPAVGRGLRALRRYRCALCR